ncbi:MAG: tetratricopeptide repeat protein [Phycisphaerae bacterium]
MFLLPFRRALVWPAAALLAAAFAAPARADSKELRALRDLATRQGARLSADDLRKLLADIERLRAAPQNAAPEERAIGLQAETRAAAANGDAQRALNCASELLSDPQPTRESLEAAYVGAAAAGDAKTADEVLRKLADVLPAAERRTNTNRRRWLKQVGGLAPSEFISTGAAAGISPANRDGKVLLIDFWNVQSAPADEDVRALKDLVAWFGDGAKLEVVGVNADSAARVERAREFVEKAGYAWPQCYEEQMTNAPITHRAFNAGNPPWQVVIDRDGRIRAVGSARDAAFVFALRAAVSEAAGERAIVVPRTIEGERATGPAAVSGAGGPGSAAGGGANAAGAPKPSDPEAASMLRQARAWIKTGRRTDAKRILQEIIAKYPNTREAEDAQYMLSGL